MIGQRLWRIIKNILLSIALILFIIIVWAISISPGKTTPFIDANDNKIPNSIAAIETPDIGGIPQGLIIRGENIDNPVLLFLHGGPGMPAYAWIKDQFSGMEKLFTICYWEQRGSGMSYSAKIPAASMTLEQLVEDAAEVSRYLINKFHKKKIFVMGHSWGSFLGSFVINKYPHLFHAYMGVGQIGNSYVSEKASLVFVKAEAIRRNDKNAIKALNKIVLPSPTDDGIAWWNYYKSQRPYVFKFGGARYKGKWSTANLKKAILFCREYKLMEKINYAAALKFSTKYLEASMLKYDLSKTLPVQHIPIFMFQGIHDQQTTYIEAKKYFDQVQAPRKRFFSFKNSAHSPHVEEYPEFERLVKTEVLASRNGVVFD